MKKPIFIIIGIVLVFILIGVWIYILFFSSPTPNDDTYANLSQDNTLDADNINQTTTIDSSLNTNPIRRLQQITTEPVAGYQEVVHSASSTPKIFYIEAGTGYIRAVDTLTATKEEISNTTINFTSYGVITTDGSYTMIQSGYGQTSQFLVGEINSTNQELTITPLTEQIVSFQDTNDNTFLYAAKVANTLIAKEYFPTSHTSKTLFTIPFLEATIEWGNSSDDVHYFHPKAVGQLEGYVYQVKNNHINRLPISGYGLSALGNTETLIFSRQNIGVYETYNYNLTTDIISPTEPILIPEKCLDYHQQATTFICGATLTDYSHNFPDVWYQGTVSYADWLWEIDITSGNSTLLIDMESESGRQLDLIKPVLSADDERLYFLNKNNKNLWLYRVIIAEADTSVESDNQ